jgi:hypothetical protein
MTVASQKWKIAILIALPVVGLGAGLAFTWRDLAETRDRLEDLRQESTRLRDRLSGMDRGGPAAPPVNLRSLERRVERLEMAEGMPYDGPLPAAASRGPRPHDAGAAVGGAVEAPAAAIQSEPLRRVVHDLVKSTTQKIREERRAERFQRRDQRVQQEVAAFGKQQGLSTEQIQQVSAILQESRDRRQEIRRQVMSSEVDFAAARKQLDEVRASTRDQMKGLLGEQGYESYRTWRNESRQTMRGLWRF